MSSTITYGNYAALVDFGDDDGILVSRIGDIRGWRRISRGQCDGSSGPHSMRPSTITSRPAQESGKIP